MIDTRASAVEADFAFHHSVVVTTRMQFVFNGLAITAVTLAALLPLLAATYWLTVSPEEAARLVAIPLGVPANFDMGMRLAALLTGLLQLLPLSWALMRLRRCLSAFARGRLFTSEGIAGLRDFAIGTATSALLNPVSAMLLGLVLSWNAGPGRRQLVLQVGSDMLILALFAAVIATLTWAMGKAAAVAEENSQFV